MNCLGRCGRRRRAHDAPAVWVYPLATGRAGQPDCEKKKRRTAKASCPYSSGQDGRLGLGTRRVRPRVRRRLGRGRRDRAPRGGRRPRRWSRPVRRTRTRRGEASRPGGGEREREHRAQKFPDSRCEGFRPPGSASASLRAMRSVPRVLVWGMPLGSSTNAPARLSVGCAMLRSGSGSASARLGSASWTRFPVTGFGGGAPSAAVG